MISVKLPDGSVRELNEGASAADLASAIGPGLRKALVAAKVDGDIRDYRLPLPDGAEVQLLTKKDPEALNVLRHSAAHLMADAILRVFPNAQLTIGPAVEDGFYYDFDFPQPVGEDDLSKLVAEMQKVLASGEVFERREVSKDEAEEIKKKLEEAGASVELK